MARRGADSGEEAISARTGNERLQQASEGGLHRWGRPFATLSTLLLASVIALGCSKGSGDKEAPGTSTSTSEPITITRTEEAHAELPRRVHLSDDVVAAAKISERARRAEVLSPALVLPGRSRRIRRQDRARGRPGERADSSNDPPSRKARP